MKKIIAMLFVAGVMAACTKEIVPEQTNIAEKNAGRVVTLFAEIPAIINGDSSSAAPASVDVKATAVGTFSWSDGDKIAVPVKDGYVEFEYSEENDDFEYTLTGSEEFVDGTAYYPASSAPEGSYSTAFDQSTNVASAGFKMEAEYTVGCSSLSFEHKSALINLNFTNVPSFATSVRVKIDGAVVATVALPVTPGATFNVTVPVTPAASAATYSFALLENSNVLREVSKSVTLTAGKYYTTPNIVIHVIQVGVIDYVYAWTGHDTGWKLYTNKGDVSLISLGVTKQQAVGSSYWSDAKQTFYMFYAPVDPAITEFKTYWTNGTNSDWFGNNGSYPANDYVFVFEYSNYKEAVYMNL